jgi:hypothetical protein
MKNLLLLASLSLSFHSSLIYADSKAVAGAKEDFQTFKKEVDKSLVKLDQDLEVLKEKAKNKSSKVKGQTVEEAKLARSKIDAQLDALKDKSKEHWSNAKKDLSASIESLSKKIQAALD